MTAIARLLLLAIQLALAGALGVTLVRHVVTDRAAADCAEKAVVARDVASRATNDSAAQAADGIRGLRGGRCRQHGDAQCGSG